MRKSQFDSESLRSVTDNRSANKSTTGATQRPWAQRSTADDEGDLDGCDVWDVDELDALADLDDDAGDAADLGWAQSRSGGGKSLCLQVDWS